MPPRVVQLRHPPGVVEPQPREELSETMQTFVNLIETQFLISYSFMTIEHSSEVQRDPSLRSIIKLLLRLIEEHTDCGAHGGLMLRTWLGLREHPYQNATNLMAMLSDHQILKKLYSRGIADLHPPRLSIHHTFQSIDLVTPEDRFTTISISGETKKTFLITSPPLSKAWLSLSSIINLANSSTVHRVDLMLDTTHTRFPDVISLPYEQYCLGQYYVTPKPMKIFIINAGGVDNPAFTFTFTGLCMDHTPDLVLITETRLGGDEGRIARLSMNFPSTTAAFCRAVRLPPFELRW